MNARYFVSFALILMFGLLLACGSPVVKAPTSSLPPGSPDRVEVNYFYESNACFCLDLATKWIDTTITTNYKTQLDSGKLVYHRYDTKDPANDKIKAEFNATNYILFITSTHGEERNTWPVSKIWMYTDSSGTSEELKTKFINELKRSIDRALAE